MKRTIWLTAACLIGGLMAALVVRGPGTHATAAAEPGSSLAAPRGLAHAARAVVINEVAWMGTEASHYDEWIELHNTTDRDLDLTGWSIVAADGTPDISLSGVIPAHGYFLLERTDDAPVSDVPADLTYTGAMENGAESLTLYDGAGRAVDTANGDGGPWPGGDNDAKRTMERVDAAAPDGDGNWASNDGAIRNGHDAEENPINGTPKCRSSVATPAADLAMRIDGLPAQAEPGDRLIYAIGLRNAGNVAAATTRLTNSLPAGLSLVAQTSPYTFSQPTPSTLAWQLGDLPISTNLSAVTVTVDVDEGAAGALTSLVTATTVVTDVPFANNTASATVAVHEPPRPADLIVRKSGPAAVDAGATITYRITLTNAGPGPALGALLTDTLPPAVDFVTQTGPFTFTPLGRDLVWQLGHVPTGTAYLITATGRVSEDASGVLTNRVTATTTTSETAIADNVALWTTMVETAKTVYLPLLFRSYTPPPYWVIIEAALYDGLQYLDYDEAVLLFNGGDQSVDLSGWELCKWRDSDWRCADLPAAEIAPHQQLWLARSEIYFTDAFGFAPDYVLPGWPGFANTGDEVVLRDADGMVRDALVYENGLTEVDGWNGPAVEPYGGTNFASEGQVLYRSLDEETVRPPADTDTAADWAQYADDPWRGRRVRYPGWDLEQFYRPARGASGTVTVGIAPDNAYQLVVDTIRSAEESIELETYTLEHYKLVNELVQKANEGVGVTVLLEGGPVGGVEDQELWACEQLHATGNGRCYFMVRSETLNIYPRYKFVHAKYMVVDRERLLLGSQNLTHSSLLGDDKGNGTGGSRGVVLVTDAPEMVARAVAIFEADCDPEHHADVSMWGPENVLGYGAPPPGFTPDPGPDWVTYTVRFPQTTTAPGTDFELVTSPETVLRTGDALLGLVGRAGAGDAVYVEQLYEYREWGDNPSDDPNLRMEASIAAARRGAKVRILLNGGDFGIKYLSLTKNVEAAAYVNEIAQAEGLDLSAHLGDPTEYGIHNKMVLVDLGAEGKYVHVGSINGSETSNKINREMALQVRSAALFNYLYAVFDYDWRHQPPQGHLLISEVMYNPAGQDTGLEWIEIYNPTTEDVNLSGWYLGDVGLGGEYGSGLYRFPSGSVLVAEGVIVVAHQAKDVAFTPDYEFLIDPNRDDASVRNMVPAGSWDGFGLALGNAGDEVLLLDANGAAVDVVTYGEGNYPGVVPHPGVSDQGHSLERRPPEEDTDDCSQDFLDRYPPTPGTLP